jgi:RNA polymerase sigma factor (sigma-70 family)
MKEFDKDHATGARWLSLYPEAKNGNQEAKNQLNGELRDFARALAKKRGADREFRDRDQSDIAQDFVLALLSLPPEQEFRGTTGAEFYAWVAKIVLRFVIDAQRHGRRLKRGGKQIIGQLPEGPNGEVAIAAGTSTPSKRVMQEEEQKELEAALSRLPDNYQQVLRLKYSSENLTNADIARRLNTTEGAVKQLVRRAIDRLREDKEFSGK